MRKKDLIPILFSVFLSVVFVAVAVNAATTISTNITTDGTLAVTGASTFTGTALFNGNLQASSTALFTGATTFYATTTIAASKLLVLGSSESNLNGASAGSIFYDSVNRSIKLYDGSQWFTVGTTTNGVQLSGSQIKMSDLTTQYVTFGTTTQTGLSVLTVTATTTTSIPLTLRAEASQTANLFQVKNILGTNLFALDASGNASTTMISTTGNIWVNGFATTTGSNGNFSTQGTLTASSTLQVTGNSLFYGTLGVASSSPYVALGVTGTTTSSAGMVVGGSGTAINQILKGTCNLIGTPTITATTTAAMDCAFTGVKVNDIIFFSQPTTTPSTFQGWHLVYANASSSAGFITFGLQNLTGVAAIPPITATSTIQVLIIR